MKSLVGPQRHKDAVMSSVAHSDGMTSLLRLRSLAAARGIKFLPKRVQLTNLYRQINGAAPDLRAPRFLSEQILHRMFYDRDPLLRTFCDKVAAKKWIEARIGPGSTPLTLAVTDSVETLGTLPLPDRWMLKASHGSGWYQLVNVASTPLNGVVIEQARTWLKTDYADRFQEWGYRNLPRRLVAEELLCCAGGQCTEVSAFSFRGQVRGIRLYRPSYSRAVIRVSPPELLRTKECFLDEGLQLLPLIRPQHDHCPELAATYQHQLEPFLHKARELSSATSFLRVDGYFTDNGVVVGELTPYPGAGIWLRMPRQWDAWFGAFWK
jgi:hypothetical protein